MNEIDYNSLKYYVAKSNQTNKEISVNLLNTSSVFLSGQSAVGIYGINFIKIIINNVNLNKI